MSCRYAFASLTLFLWVMGALAQDPPEKDKPTHDEIRAVRDALLEAIKKKDVDAVLTHLHPDVVLTSQDGNEQKVIRKHEGVRDYITRQLTGPNAYIKSVEPSVTVDEWTILHGDATGIAFGSSNDRYVLANGSTTQLATRWSTTLVKYEGKWKVANLQYSTNLFDNPVLTGVKQMTYWTGGIAAAVGLLAGLLIMKLIRK